MFLPEFDRDYLLEKGYQFEEKIDANRNGLIIRNWFLPTGKSAIIRFINHTTKRLS